MYPVVTAKIFAVTTDPFIVLSSSIFAIMGLRALYLLLADIANHPHYHRSPGRDQPRPDQSEQAGIARTSLSRTVIKRHLWKAYEYWLSGQAAPQSPVDAAPRPAVLRKRKFEFQPLIMATKDGLTLCVNCWL